MTDKKKRKILAVSFVNIISVAVICTNAAAYFTDKRDASDVFTIGDVEIELSEPAFDASKYTALCPNQQILKNPTVSNTGPSPAFIKAEILIPYIEDGFEVIDNTSGNGDYLTKNELFRFTPNADWAEYEAPSVIEYEGLKYSKYSYLYQHELGPGENATVFDCMYTENITDNQPINGMNFDLPVMVYAIQSDGLTLETAFSEYDEQFKQETEEEEDA